MDINKCREVLTKLLRGKVSGATISTTPIINLIHKRLCMDIEDVCVMLLKEPAILYVSPEELVDNFHAIEAEFDVSLAEFRNLLFHRPNLLITKGEKIKFRVNLVSTIFDISKKDALRLLYFFPTLFSLSKNDVVRQIEFLTNVLDEEDFVIRMLIRKEPRLLFVDETLVDLVKKFMTIKLGFGKIEFTQILEKCPEILFINLQDAESVFNKFCGKIYAKQEFRSIISKQPLFLSLSCEELDARFAKIMKTFGVSEKQAYDLIREVPQILFYDLLEKNMFMLSELKINKNYILTHPKLLIEPQNSVNLKFMLAVVCNLVDDFEEFISQSVNKLLQKYLFLKSYNLSEYRLMLLSDSEFERRFNLSKQQLEKYSISTSELYKLIEQFLKNKNVTLNSQNLPSVETLIDFTSKDIKQLLPTESLRCEYFSVIKNLGFTTSESLYVLNVNPSVVYFSPLHTQNIFAMILKLVSSREEAVRIILQKPFILSYSTKDLEKTLMTISTERNVELADALQLI